MWRLIVMKRNKKIDLANLDDEIAEFDGAYMAQSNPEPYKAHVGTSVYVNMPEYSRKLRFLKADQHEKLILSEEEFRAGCLKLDNDMLMYPNKTYEVRMTPQIKDFLAKGILRGGGRMHGAINKKPIIVRSIFEIEKEEKDKAEAENG
jgi:hypothetical protein